jgi:hypothetical protein
MIIAFRHCSHIHHKIVATAHCCLIFPQLILIAHTLLRQLPMASVSSVFQAFDEYQDEYSKQGHHSWQSQK